jgi:hypothetical protein
MTSQASIQMATPDTCKAIPLKIVVIGDLFPGPDGPPSVDANTCFALHDPLLSLAIRITGVVDESSKSPFCCCIEHKTPACMPLCSVLSCMCVLCLLVIGKHTVALLNIEPLQAIICGQNTQDRSAISRHFSRKFLT